MPSSNTVQREIWLISFPMFLTGISTPLLGMVDTAVVGHLPQPYFLAAIALGSMIFNLLFWAMGFLRMGTTGLTARALGLQDDKEKVLVLYRGLLLALILGFLLILLQQPIKQMVFYFIETTPEVSLHAKIYFDIRIWSAPATLATYVLLGWYLGLQRPRFNLFIVISINLINILFDIFFVVYWDLNSAGVAWATLIAEYAGLMFGFMFVSRVLSKKEKIDWKMIFHLNAVKEYLELNLNVFIRTLFLLFSLSFFTIQSAKFGPIVLAANAILMNLQTLMAYVLDSLAHAAEVLVGKYKVKESKHQLLLVLKITGWWSAAIAVFIALGYSLSGKYIIYLLTSIEAVKISAQIYLPWLILSPLISVWSFWFDGIFIGAGYSREMRNTMLFSFVIFMITWTIFLPWGNHGLWLALMSLMLARALSMAFVANQKWKSL